MDIVRLMYSVVPNVESVNKNRFQVTFLLIFMIIVIYYCVSPATSFAQLDDSLQSYNNPVAGIMLSYPSQWILVREFGNGIQLVYPSTQQQFGGTLFLIAGILSNITEQQFEDIGEVKTSQQYIDFVHNIFSSGYNQSSATYNADPTISAPSQFTNSFEVLDHNNTKVDGKPSHQFQIQYKSQFAEPTTHKVIYTLYGGAMYLIEYVSPSNEYSHHLQTINGIINSIKLSGISKENLKSNYTTFSSVLMGIKLDYPAYWVPAVSDISSPQVLSLGIPEQLLSTKLVGGVMLSIIPNYNHVSFEQLPSYTDDYFNSAFPQENQKKHLAFTHLTKQVMLNNHAWYEYGFRYNEPFTNAEIISTGLITIKDDRVYVLRYDTYNDKYFDYQPELERIENSLTFLDNSIR